MSALDAPAHAAFQRTQFIIDALPRAIVVTDLRGLVIGVNSVATALYEWSTSEAVGTNLYGAIVGSTPLGAPIDVTDAASSRCLGEQILDEVSNGSTWRGDFVLVRSDAKPKHVRGIVAPLIDDTGAIVGTVAAADDAHQAGILQQQSEQLAAHLLLAVEAGELGTFRWTMATGETVWDERLEQLFGLEAGEFEGTYDAYVALLHPDDRDRVLATVADAVAQKTTYRIDHRVQWRDGSVHWLQGRGSVTLDPAGEVTGTIGCVGDITAMKQAEEEAALRELLATQAAERERRHRERLEFLVSVTDAAIEASDHAEFMAAVASAAVPRLGDWCSIHFQPESAASIEVEVAHCDDSRVAWAKELSQRYPYDPTASSGVPEVIRTGRLEFIPQVTQTVINEALERSTIGRDEAQVIVDALTLTSVITVPLITKRGVIGAMRFVSAESGRIYENDDVILAQVIAGRIAEALGGLWQADQHREISSTLQHALLPSTIPTIDGLDIAVRHWPAGAAVEVGGDFYDLYAVDDDRWAVVIGDVCGTGPTAAAVTGVARHTIRAAATHGQDHQSVLGWLNDAVRDHGVDLFCTACYATIELTDGGWQVTSASGGHPLPIVARANGTTEVIGSPGTILGVYENTQATAHTIGVGPGDVIVFYTDGVTDLPPPYGISPVEFEQIVGSLRATGTADDIADAIDASITARVPPSSRDDDIALVVIMPRA